MDMRNNLVLFLAAAMAVWHGVDYLEREVLTVDPFYRSWQPVRSDKLRRRAPLCDTPSNKGLLFADS